MAATLQHCNTATTTQSPLKSTTTSPNPQLKRLVYSKYRELLGSYNDQANAYIDTLPSYMVHKDNGFNIELKNETPTVAHAAAITANTINLTTPPPGGNEMYGSGQRMPGQSTYEAPACVQNAMNRDKKPFTYTPGGIDLSQIKSERMAKRLARNACIEGAAGQSQLNRPTQPMPSPGSPGSAAASMGAAAMGMPFQVLPPTPHPTAGKNQNGGSAPAPPPPPPSSSNFLNTGIQSQMNGVNGGRGSAPNSPNMPRKAPAGPPQRFEPPPLGFRPEIKIPVNPMAALRKVPPPVEKNTFWKDEYKKNKGIDENAALTTATSPNISSNNYNTEDNDSVNGSSSSTPQTNASNGTEYTKTNGETNNKSDNSDITDGFKRTMPTTTTNRMQQNQTTNITNTQEQEETIKTPPKSSSPPTPAEAEKTKSKSQSPREQSQDTQSITSISSRPTPPTSPFQQQQFTSKPTSPPYATTKPVERESATPPVVASPPKPVTPPQTIQIQAETQQKQQSPKPEFRSVAAAPVQSAVNVYNRQTDSPRSVENATPPRASESPFKYAQQQQQQRAPVTMSPLAQQTTPSSASSGASISPNPPQAQTVPWRTQRGQTPQKQQPVASASAAQSYPQPFYNNVQPQQQQQQQTPRAPDFSTQASPYQGPKPTNVGSLYIAPLAQPSEPQAQHIVRQQQLQQQQQQPQRDSPMRQMGGTQPNAQANLRWMSSQPKSAEQPAWVRPEENSNVVPSSLNRLKSPPPPPPAPSSLANQQQPMYTPLSMNPGNGFMTIPSAPHNFGAQPIAPTGLRLQINTQSIQNQNQTGPRERIIPIQLEQTPTYTPSTQPGFNTPSAYGAGSVSPAPGYVMRTPNQFVDQGYNNFASQQPQRVVSPPMQQQQLNAPRMVQQQQQQSTGSGNTRTHIIPIAMDNSEGTRGPVSKTPIVIQNDLRTPPVQSKSFRILQKITDTIDDGSNDDSGNNQQRNDNYMDAEPQLQRPTFARQMSAQQARNSPTVEQMRRMKIGHEQGNSLPQTPPQFNQQPRPSYNNNNDYVPPSEQHVPEPKKYTGSAIPSRSFKILQAMTQPENAGEHDDNSHDESNDETNDETKSEHNNESCASSSSVEPTSSASMSSLNSDSVCSAPTPPPPPPSSQPITYPQYPYPYGYPWYPPPCQPMPSQTNGDTNTTNWPYPYAMPPPPPPTSATSEIANPPNWSYPYAMPPPQRPASPAGDNIPTHPYAPYPYFYPYPYAMPQFPPQTTQSSEFVPYLPPPPPYHAYPYPVAPSYSQSSSSSRASSVLPDIIITPSTDDSPSKMIMQHHVKVEREEPAKRSGSIEIEDVSTTIKPKQLPTATDGSIVDILTHHLQNLEQNNSQTMENNLNLSSRSTKKSYKKNFDQKSPDDNTSPVQITMVMTESEQDSDIESSDSDVTTKQYDTQLRVDDTVPPPLQSIRSVSNVQFYNGHNIQNNKQEESDDDDSTTADGESDIFDDDEGEEGTISGDFEYERRAEQPDSECEEFYVQDNLSVIYEEESDLEKSSELTKSFKVRPVDRPDDLENCIEENDEEEEETANLVTATLPLKFSFAKSSNDEPITTVEVGKSLVEDRRNSLTLSDKRNSFSVATLNDSDDDADSDSCDVSVTISLSPSSRSGSVDSKDGFRNMADKYPIEDMPLPEHTLPDIASSEEDVSFSFSLNKRNKFVGQTLQGDITNNIAHIEDEMKPPSKNMDMSKLKQSTEELDFFATLRATKMQAQQIKDQTANYWGKSVERKDDKMETGKSEEHPETVQADDDIENVKEIKCNNLDDLEVRTSFWSNFSTKKSTEGKELDLKLCKDSESQLETTQPIESKNDPKSYWDNYSALPKKSETNNIEEPEEIEDIWANRDDDFGAHNKSQSNYRDRYSKPTKVTTESEVSTVSQGQSHLITEENEEESEDIWATKNKDDTPIRSSQSYNGYSDFQQELETKTTKQPDEVFHISTVGKENITPSKNLSKKLNPLETAKNSFWSTFAETNKPTADIMNDDIAITTLSEAHKCQLIPETIRELNYSPPVLRHRIEELSKCLTPLIHFEWEPTEETHEENAEDQDEDTDFWTKMEEARQSPELQSEALADTKTYHSLFEQEEEKSSFWNNEKEVENSQEYVSNTYDPLNYPEEPREVDTDEEIDFWAEIEAKRDPDDDDDDDDVTFHRAATFWASQDHKNSVDETPYTPVLTKPFTSKLPDEPATPDISVWAALEAHKGEEPVLIDPQVEEEKELAQEFDEMSQEKDSNEDHNTSMFDIASVHEPVVSSVWNPTQMEEVDKPQAPEEIDFWSEIDSGKSDSLGNKKTEFGNDDLEIKRNNYRKAMAFFTTSIDDHKIEAIESPLEANAATSAQSNSQAEEEDKWDWEAVKEAVKEQPKEETPKPEEERKAMKPPKKERKPKNSLGSKSPPKADIAEVCKTSLEVTDLSNVYVEPTLNLGHLSNGLPDLEVNKFSEESKVSVRDRISVFENGSFDAPDSLRSSIQNQSLSVDSSNVIRQSSLSRNSSTQRSESEIEEDDSGVTDMNKLSETETESDSFPELKKMTSYQRAATHSRLFKLLQDDTDGLDESKDENANVDEHKLRPSRKKVVHNVSITRKQNPNVTADVETLMQRRERLSLPLRKNISIDADNPSTPNSPASPIMGESAANQCVVSDKLVSELVQSLLLKSDSTHLRKLPMAKLQAAAKRVLEEELDSLENTSVESTPSMTPNDAKKDKSYADYYNTWSDANGAGEIVPSKSFKALQDSRRSPWTARCPRVLSSKTINSDLTRVSESPEISMRSSKSQSRENSVGRWRKV